MTPDHAVLQKIGCHGRVNVGNFESDLRDHVFSLYDRGDIVLAIDEHGEQWVSLTRLGQSNLITLNCNADAQLTLDENQTSNENN